MIYSILFDKTIYHVHGAIRQLMREMFKDNINADLIIDYIVKELKKDVPMRGESKKSIENALMTNIVYSAKKKNLICRLSAMFDEEGLYSSNYDSISTIIKKLYQTPVDVEHIHSTKDTSIAFDNQLQDTIGNLVLLEFSLNRSLQEKPYSEKRIRYTLESSIGSVKKIAENHSEWGIKEAIDRRNSQIIKIVDYFYGENKRM